LEASGTGGEGFLAKRLQKEESPTKGGATEKGKKFIFGSLGGRISACIKARGLGRRRPL